MNKKIFIILNLTLPLITYAADTRLDPRDERFMAMQVRTNQALVQTINRAATDMSTENNGDEFGVPFYAAQMTKLLEHDPVTGLLTANGIAGYSELYKAVHTGKQADYNAITLAPIAQIRVYPNPQSANACSMQAEDTSLYVIPLPYNLDSAQAAADMIEVYLQAICRDVSFDEYGTGVGSDVDTYNGGSLTDNAALILNALGSAYTGPKEGGVVTANVLFRGNSAGDLVGPYVSQFFLQSFLPLFPAGCVGPVAALTGVPNLPGLSSPFTLNVVSPFVHHPKYPIEATREFGVGWSDFVNIQNGTIPHQYVSTDYQAVGNRYVINGRDWGSWVHYDGPYEAYYNALFMIAARGFPLSPAFPYANGDITKEGPMHTMGGSDVFTLVGGVCIEAFKASWAQKWRCNRRLRPEAMAGLVHRAKVTGLNPFNLDASLFATYSGIDLLAWVQDKNSQQNDTNYPANAPLSLADASTYLLSQMFPEGAPAHPTYPSGHATVAGACVTVLKAIFNNNTKINTRMTPAKPNASGTALVALSGEGENDMTLGSELDKLASNVSLARDFAGVHFRQDAEQGILLGEQVAIAYLQDRAATYSEDGFTGYVLTKRNGTTIRITAGGVTVI